MSREKRAKRIPSVSAAADKKAVPRSAVNTDSYQKSTVRWTVSDLDNDPGATDGRRWNLNADELIELLRFLEALEKKTWRECEQETAGGHRRNHYHDIADLSRQAQKRLEKIPDSEDRVFRFRLKGKCRLWGFRSGDLFRILWYDPEHAVYPVGKRHT